MKFKFLSLLLLSATLFMVSCGEDDPMEPEVCDVLSETILGTWNASNISESGEITFNEDGTYVDNDNIILEYSNNGVEATIYTYELDSMDITFTTTIDPAEGSGFASTTLTVTDFDCKNINASLGGFLDINFTK